MPQINLVTYRTIKAVIFDMDNTLFDFVAAKLHACRQVAEYVGRTDGDRLFEYFLHGPHGFEHHENIKEYLTDRRCFSEEIYRQCIHIYQQEKISALSPYPEIHRILEEVRSRTEKMAILTDAHRDNALLRLDRLNMRSYFDFIITADMTGTKKPAPEPFRLALELLNTPAYETLLIGDSIRRDIVPGKLLGMITAYAKYGDRNIRSLEDCSPDIVLDSVKDITLLLPWIDGKEHHPGGDRKIS